MKRRKTLLSLSTIIYILAIVVFIIINCNRDNPFDINASNYTPGKKPHVHFVDSLISGYLLDTIKIPITWEDTAIGSSSGAIKKFYIDWNGDGHFSDSISGVETATVTLSKVFNSQSNWIRIKAIDFDGDTSATDSARLDIKLSTPAITSVNSPATIEMGVSFTIKLNSADTGGVITSYLWAIDEKEFSRTTDSGSLTLSFNQTGNKTIQVKARDNKKIESVPRVISIGVIDPSDTVGPQITFLSPLSADTIRTRDCVVSLQVVDASGISGVTLNDVIAMQLVGLTWRGTISLNQGENVLTAKAIDSKGHKNVATIHVFYSQATFDQTPPVITLLAPSKWTDTVNTDSLIVKLLARDESGVAGMSLDTEQLKVDIIDTSYSTVRKLKEGLNKFVVRSVDRKGNNGFDSLLVFWKKEAVDTVGPVITITKPLYLQHITDSVLSISGTVTDASGMSSINVNGIETVIHYPDWSATCNLKRGFDTITITATDGSINRNSSEKSVIVIRNQQPLFTEVPHDTFVVLNSSVTFSSVVTDDDNALVFSLASAPMTFGTVSPLVSTMSNASFTYTAGNIGVDTCKLIVSDPWGDVDTAKWCIVVLALSDSTPIITTDPKTLPLTITALDTCRDTVHAQDPYGKPLIYSFVQPAPTGIIIDSLTGKIIWAPIATDTGAKVIIIQVSNGQQKDSITWNITVLSRDLPPKFSSLGNQTINENQKLQLTLNATDFNNDLLEFSFGSTFPAGAQLDSNRFSWTPTLSNAGEHKVTFVVRERNRTPSLSDTQTITIVVVNVNQKPVLINPGTIKGVITKTINYPLSATDPDNDRITYSMIDAPSSSQLNANIFSWTPFFGDAKTYYVKFIANDGLLSDTIAVAVIINNANSAPVFTDIGNRTMSENQLIQFTLAASDPNGDSLIFSIKNPPPGSKLEGGLFSWRPTYTQAGKDTIKFYVQDNVNPPLYDSQTVIITVNNVNAPPELTSPGNRTVNENTQLRFDLTASDIDNNTLTYSMSTPPPGAVFNANRFTWTPSFDQSGTYPVTFYVADNGDPSLRDTQTITIIVNNTNPFLPVLVSPTENASSQPKSITFRWNKSLNGTNGYFLQIAQDTGFANPFFHDSTLTDTVKTVSGFLNGTKYYWRVNALNPGGRSGWTIKRSFATIPNYALSITAINGYVTSSPSSGPFDSATVVSLTAVHAAGYHFTSWSGDASGTDMLTSVTMNSAKSITANFVLNPSSAKTLTAFSFASPATTGTIDEITKRVVVSVPYGTNVSALVVTFATTGATVKVGSTVQVSGTTPNNFTIPVTYTVTAADNSTQSYIVTVTVAANSAKTLTAFSFANLATTGIIDEVTKRVAVSVQYGTDVSALVATFATTGATVKVGPTMQVSGTTSNNFTTPVTYTVTAADNSTQSYVVTVTEAANNAKSLTSLSFASPLAMGTINEIAKTVAVSVPYGTNLTALVATFATTGAIVKVGSDIQVSGTTPNNFSTPVTYIVTAADNSTQNYTVTVNVAANPAKALTLFNFANLATGTINEIAKTVAVSVPYGTNLTALVATFATTGATVKVGSDIQLSGTSQNNFSTPVTYTVTAADNSTENYVVMVTVAANTAKALILFNITNSAATGIIDEINNTVAVNIPYGTNLTALVATFATTGATVKVGSTIQVSGTTANDFSTPVTYTVTAADNSTKNYTVTVTVAANPAKVLTSFNFASPAVTGTIDETTKTVAVSVPYGTNLTALVATFATTGATVRVGATVQASGITSNNFTAPVIYTVIAADASTQEYVVMVTVAANPAKVLTSFNFASPAVTGTIDETTKRVAVSVPYGTNLTALVATFATTGTTVRVGAVVQASGITSNNFTASVTYTVVAADASTQDYVVSVTVAANPAKALTAFSFVSLATTGIINEANKKIVVSVPYSTNLTALVATFATTGASVRVGETAQASGTTSNNFTAPVTYTVVAEDASTQAYEVTVIVAANPAKALTSFNFVSPAVTGIINETAKTIAVNVPYGTDRTSLIATFVSTGNIVLVGSTVQGSGATANNFDAPVTYTVIAEDASSERYVVTVTVAANPAKALTSFSFQGLAGTGTINEATVTVTVPYGTPLTALVATFATTGENVSVGSEIQESGTTANDFSSPVTYTVTAADNSTQNYVVTVTVAADPGAKALTAFGFVNPAVTGIIDEDAKTITLSVPNGTVVTDIIATFVSTGASVRVGAVVQESGITSNGFSEPITYTVVAADASTEEYVVTVLTY